MTTNSNVILQTHSPLEQKQQESHFPLCTLKWRQGQLFVKTSPQAKQIYLPATDDKQRLVECLKHSPVSLIRIDPDLGETRLMFWADACERANKKVFLRIPSACKLLKKRSTLSWKLKRIIDWSAAAILLLALSPLLLGLVLLMRIYLPEPIFFWQWRVGHRGKLFRIIKFRTTVVDVEKPHHQVSTGQNSLFQIRGNPQSVSLGCWLRKFRLDELPQLFNVLRGEMSLVGPCPLALHDALRLSPEGQKQLNALPGITGAWQMEARSTLLDLNVVDNFDLEYLRNWSLCQDLKILLQTIPKVLLGFGAY